MKLLWSFSAVLILSSIASAADTKPPPGATEAETRAGNTFSVSLATPLLPPSRDSGSTWLTCDQNGVLRVELGGSRRKGAIKLPPAALAVAQKAVDGFQKEPSPFLVANTRVADGFHLSVEVSVGDKTASSWVCNRNTPREIRRLVEGLVRAADMADADPASRDLLKEVAEDFAQQKPGELGVPEPEEWPGFVTIPNGPPEALMARVLKVFPPWKAGVRAAGNEDQGRS